MRFSLTNLGPIRALDMKVSYHSTTPLPRQHT